MFSHILVEFLFRLTFGVATAMGLTPSGQVTSGFFRVHLWVLLGMQTLAALALRSGQTATSSGGEIKPTQFWLAVAAAVLSYVGAVVWMYERRMIGKIFIWAVAGAALAGCWLSAQNAGKPVAMQLADRLSGGLVLGFVTTAMLLGHWYLNTPTMKLAPLRRLVILLALAVVVRMAICLVGTLLNTQPLDGARLNVYFLALRWLTGLAGVLGLAGLTWQTLKIPNTQSATGILYAAVILAFIGELTSQLLSAEVMYPV